MRSRMPSSHNSCRQLCKKLCVATRDVLEAQHIRTKERPQFKPVDIALDAGPGKMLWVLDKLLREESEVRAVVA